jgi:hypothetical protein
VSSKGLTGHHYGKEHIKVATFSILTASQWLPLPGLLHERGMKISGGKTKKIERYVKKVFGGIVCGTGTVYKKSMRSLLHF